MPLKSIRAWLGVDRPEKDEFAPLRETLEALDHLEPDRARYLGAFAYLLGRVAHADQHVSPEETSAMEALVHEHGQLPHDQAMIVVQLAKTSNLLFGGTANFLVAREFSALATYDQKLALMRCLFEVSATDEAISTAEEGEIHRIANELRIDQPDLLALRVAHRRHLPGVSTRKPRASRVTPLNLLRNRPVVSSLVAAVALATFLGGAVLAVGRDKALYVRGTLSALKERTEGRFNTQPANELTFSAGKKGTVAIPYAAMASLEFEQKERTVVIIGFAKPVSKHLFYYLTIAYSDPEGRQQRGVFELGKDIVPALLKLLEARSGKAITFQDTDTCRQYKTPEDCEGK